MHLKRINSNKLWSIPRKGTKYVAVASHNNKDSVPLITVMRDILKIVKNQKELKKCLNEKAIQINFRNIIEPNYPVGLFDIVTLVHPKKNYKSILSANKKMIFEEIPENEAEKKIFKIIGKKILPGKKIQLNLSQGRNILSKEKAETGDSILLNLKDNKIIKIIPLEKGKEVFVIKGKHAGLKGKINDIVVRGGKKIAKIISDGEKLNVWVKNLVIIE